VTWSASASGGNGRYYYSWSGTDSLYGNSQSISKLYSNTGLKTAYVTITSDGQTASTNCTNSVNITPVVTQVINPVNYVVNTQNTLDIGCFVDPNAMRTSARLIAS
jgi:hypothetical protein